MTMEIKEVPAGSIIDVAQKYRFNGYRLMQQCATRTEIDGDPENMLDGEPEKVPANELIYTFGKGLDIVEQVKVTVRDDEEISSISSVFPNAFLYENEMHDLFGVKINMISLDYQGNFYRTAIPAPFKS